MKKRPDKVNILGKEYTIKYFDKPSEVDRNGRKSVWGQVDFWERQIRVYDNKTTLQDLWDTIIHEILHALIEELNLDKNCLNNDRKKEEELVGLLAMGLIDVLFRNDIIKFGK